MKFTMIAFLFLSIFTIVVDLLGWMILRKEYNRSKGSIIHYTGVGLFLILPILSIITSFVLALKIRDIASPTFYEFYLNFIIIWLCVYLPKLVYVVYHLSIRSAFRVANFVALKRKSLDQTTRKYPKISRVKFLSQMGIIFATLPLISLLFGFFKGRFAFFTRHQRLSFPNLPQSFDGFKIIQISDIHLGSFASNFHKLEEIVDLINGENADIICFTGDLVNNFMEETIGWDKVFTKLHARYGKFSILGNHDYGDYTNWPSKKEKEKNFEGIIRAHKNFGFKLLRDQSISLHLNGEEIAITGVENWGHDPFPRYGDLTQAAKGTSKYPFKLLLSHDPDHWDAEVIDKTKFDLTLAGHTHGMQFGLERIGIKWSPAQYKFKRWDGLYKHNNQFLYVNRGLGFLGMPARIGMPPEITVIELRKGPIGTEPM